MQTKAIANSVKPYNGFVFHYKTVEHFIDSGQTLTAALYVVARWRINKNLCRDSVISQENCRNSTALNTPYHRAAGTNSTNIVTKGGRIKVSHDGLTLNREEISDGHLKANSDSMAISTNIENMDRCLKSLLQQTADLQRKNRALEKSSIGKDKTICELEDKLFTVLATLRQELMCPICFEVLVHPVTLSCRHSVCKRCWSDWQNICLRNAEEKCVLCTKLVARMKTHSPQAWRKLRDDLRRSA